MIAKLFFLAAPFLMFILPIIGYLIVEELIINRKAK